MITGFNGVSSGISALIVGLKLILPGGGMFRYAIAPAIFSLLLIIGFVAGSWVLAFDVILDALKSAEVPDWLPLPASILSFIAGLLISVFLFNPMLMLLGPLCFDPICEKVHILYTGRPLIGKRSAAAFLKRQLFTIWQAIAWSFVSLLIQLPLAVVAAFTGAGAIVTFPIAGFVGGCDLLDYPLALRHEKFGHKAQFCWRYRYPLAGLGGMSGLLFLVPLLNMFITPAGVAGATILMLAADEPGTHTQKSGSA
ncbi:MAG: EI24 domain-containing protein [Nitrospira sp.]|nr:EI24 domain-containing protein [Nitrospira sp.]